MEPTGEPQLGRRGSEAARRGYAQNSGLKGDCRLAKNGSTIRGITGSRRSEVGSQTAFARQSNAYRTRIWTTTGIACTFGITSDDFIDENERESIIECLKSSQIVSLTVE